MDKKTIEQIAQNQMKNQRWQQYIEYMGEQAMRQEICSQATFELTAQCTLRCKMCFVRLDKEQCDSIGQMRTAAEWIDMARQFRDAGGLTILLTGGEAMMRPDFLEIYDAISRMGLLVTVFTNGTTVTDAVMEEFQKRPPALIGLTLYGASPETYERTCGWAGGYKRAIEGMDRLLSIPNIHMDVRFTACSLNVQDYEQVKALVEERGLLLTYDFGDAASVRGAVSQARRLRLTGEQKAIIQRSAARAAAPVLDSMHQLREKETEEAGRKERFGENPKKKEIAPDRETAGHGDRELQCRAGALGVYIAWDGRMYPCDMLSAPFSKPFEQGFTAAYQELLPQLHKILVPEKCMNCQNRMTCGPCAAKLIAELEACKREGVSCDYVPLERS